MAERLGKERLWFLLRETDMKIKDRLEIYKEFCEEQRELTRRLVEREYQNNGISELCLQYIRELDSWKETLINIRVFEENEVER